ncbi:hypothetical protein ACFY93_17525 [Streptomyces sp. NPDC008313]|uniref:hypothetical protein n=1 Tax=Streptomyces sp. NPDC008313 TaxID=3364826 RepID=UPI0036EDB67E
MDERPSGAGDLIRGLEGHLLIEAARSEGRAEAARFTREFDWLPDSRRAEVEERFTERYLALSRRSWQRTARRGAQLRAEYERAYRLLRRRLCACLLLGAAAACVPAAAVLTAVRG